MAEMPTIIHAANPLLPGDQQSPYTLSPLFTLRPGWWPDSLLQSFLHQGKRAQQDEAGKLAERP